MNYSSYIDNNNIKHISVTGEFISKEQVNTFLNLLDEEAVNEIKITFLDANILQTDIVEKLYHINKKRKCNIFVLKKYLYAYLLSLGIRCIYVPKISLNKRNEYTPREQNLKEDEVISFLEDIYGRYGYDYRDYQIESLKRRINLCMMRENVRSFKEFQERVLNEEDVFEQLFLDFSINTTEFFRDPNVFLVIRDKILPYLTSYAHIKVWCVGCSSGKEPYSLAILLQELGLSAKTQIYATDINPYVIEEAKNGIFPISDIEQAQKNYLSSGGSRNFIDYFEATKDYIKVKNGLKKNILFFQHSLVGSGSLNEFQLILCRNVLIYFNTELQKKVLKNFYASLDRSGFLVLGKSEGIILNDGHKYFTTYANKEKIFRLKK